MYGTTSDDDDNDRLNDVTTAAIMRRGQSGTPINITIRTLGPEAVPGLAAGSAGRAPDGIVNGAPYSLESRGAPAAAPTFSGGNALANHFARKAEERLGAYSRGPMQNAIAEPWNAGRVAQDAGQNLRRWVEMDRALTERLNDQDNLVLRARQNQLAHQHSVDTDRNPMGNIAPQNGIPGGQGVLSQEVRAQMHELRAQLQNAARVMQSGFVHGDALDRESRLKERLGALQALGNNPAYRAMSTSFRMADEQGPAQRRVQENYRGAAREVSAPYARGMDERGARPEQRSPGIQAPYADPD